MLGRPGLVIHQVFDTLKGAANFHARVLNRLGEFPSEQAVGHVLARYLVQRFLIAPRAEHDDLSRTGLGWQHASARTQSARSLFGEGVVAAGIDDKNSHPGIFECVLYLNQRHTITLDLGFALGVDISGQQQLGRSNLYSVPGKVEHHLIALANIRFERINGAPKPFTAQVVCLRDSEPSLCQDAGDQPRIVAGVFEFFNRGVRIVANHQRNALGLHRGA